MYVRSKLKYIQTWGSLATSWGINKTMAQVHALLLVSNELAELAMLAVVAKIKVRRFIVVDLSVNVVHNYSHSLVIIMTLLSKKFFQLLVG